MGFLKKTTNLAKKTLKKRVKKAKKKIKIAGKFIPEAAVIDKVINLDKNKNNLNWHDLI